VKVVRNIDIAPTVLEMLGVAQREPDDRDHGLGDED
jgi:hypothetical protein